MAVLRRFVPLLLVLSGLVGCAGLAADDPADTHRSPFEGTIVLTDNLDAIHPGRGLMTLEDPGGELTIEDVQGPALAERWHPSDRPTVNFGLTDSVVWVRLRLFDRSRNAAPWFLEIEHPTVDLIDVYQRRGESWRVSKSGDQLPFSSREINHRNFLFRLHDPGEPAEVYLRIYSGGGTALPLAIRSHRDLARHLDVEQMVLGVYYGLMGIMIVYNLSLFFSLRSPVYLTYVVYITSYTLLYLSWNGLIFQHFWPANRPWSNLIVPNLIVITHVASLQFTRQFLETRDSSPRLDLTMRVQMGVGLLLAIMTSFGTRVDSNIMIAIYTSVVILTMIAVGIRTLLKGVRAARFYVLAVGVVLISAQIALLRVAGLIEFNVWTQYCNQIGTAIEVALLSLALGDRINIMRAEREAARAEALENRRRADELKDQFLSNISHELRTPLAEVYGYAEMLADEEERIDPELHSMVRTVHQASGRLAELIQDLMLLTNLDAEWDGEIGAVNLAEVAEDGLGQLSEPISEKGLAIVVRKRREPTVQGDRPLLCKACYHVIKNAVLYNRDGGLVEVELDGTESTAEFSVRDTGIGIAPENHQKVFDKFYRVDSSLTYSVSGVGLGLFVVRRIIELHGGRVRLESEEGVGTTLRLSLPLGEPAMIGGQSS